MTEEVVVEGAQPDIQVVKERVLVWGVGVGSKGTVRVSWPDSEYFFEVRPPRGNKERLQIDLAGVTYDSDARGTVSAWDKFLAQAEVQVVDFCLPKYDREQGEFAGVVRYVRENGGRNAANITAYDSLDKPQFDILLVAMNALSGDGDKEIQEAFDRLKNEHGLLVQPTQK